MLLLQHLREESLLRTTHLGQIWKMGHWPGLVGMKLQYVLQETLRARRPPALPPETADSSDGRAVDDVTHKRHCP
jgi:hypothetical protein